MLGNKIEVAIGIFQIRFKVQFQNIVNPKTRDKFINIFFIYLLLPLSLPFTFQ